VNQTIFCANLSHPHILIGQVSQPYRPTLYIYFLLAFDKINT